MEALAYPQLSSKDVELAESLLNKLGLRFIPTTMSIYKRAASLRRHHGFGALDAIHIASALEAEATHFVTNDQGILGKSMPSLRLVALTDAAKLNI